MLLAGIRYEVSPAMTAIFNENWTDPSSAPDLDSFDLCFGDLVAMARGFLLCAVVLFSSCVIVANAHLSGYTTPFKVKRAASVKVVVHNVADRTVTFTCAELGKGAKPVVVDKGRWTAIGPIDVTVEKNSILHLTVTVRTGKRYGLVRKSMVINLLKQFQYNLEGSKFVVITAIENAREQMLMIKLGKRGALSFNLY